MVLFLEKDNQLNILDYFRILCFSVTLKHLLFGYLINTKAKL